MCQYVLGCSSAGTGITPRGWHLCRGLPGYFMQILLDSGTGEKSILFYNQMPPEHTKDVWRAGLASPGEGVQWARGRERPSLEPWAPVSSWAAGRTLGHGCPSWTLLCHLVAVICNCGRPRTARGADPVGRFQVCEADRGSPAYPSLGSIARTPPAADRGCVALLWPGWSPLPLDGGQGLSCPRGYNYN